MNCSRGIYHRLCCKHVFVPELEVFNVFQDYFFVFSALKEIGAANDGRSPRRLVPLDVHRIWLIVGLNSPGKNKKGGGGVASALAEQCRGYQGAGALSRDGVGVQEPGGRRSTPGCRCRCLSPITPWCHIPAVQGLCWARGAGARGQSMLWYSGPWFAQGSKRGKK